MNRRRTAVAVLLAVASVAAAAPALGSPIRWLTVPLGAHRFGHLRPPDAVAARAPADAVGFECGKPSACAGQVPEGGGCGCIDVLPEGPTSFDVAANGSVWVLDGVRHRVVAWRGRRLVATVRLPADATGGDVALGRDGTIYVFGGRPPHAPGLALYALTRRGRIRWVAPTTVVSGQARLTLAVTGALYAVGPSAAPTWTPLTTPDGRPLPVAVQRSRSSRLQPLDRGLRLLATLVSPHEAHFAVVGSGGAIVRAWRVTSRTTLATTPLVPRLLGDDLVVALEAYGGAGRTFRSEDVVLRLPASGGPAVRFALDARAVWDPDGTTAHTTLRVGADGRLYQLRTSPTTGVAVARYSLAHR